MNPVALAFPKVLLLTRRDCCLCDEAKRVIAEVQGELGFEFEERDIDADPQLTALYSDQVPVVFIGGRKAFKYRLSSVALKRKLVRSACRQGPGPSGGDDQCPR